ncbi:MAG: ABC-F family ATP-binding cassette domain-containing protein [Saprospiraceae bacterium]|nr:ABC-F family ATP-binding cassette domain-containing protein [Saprospiraceae bacterium]MCB9325113.1 ABC-F family ATP-binding cassette domain-containing protein [Lewinellaceae bacterium]
MNYLTLEQVSKSYGEKVLFDHIDLTINKGQKVALVAKNGEGKSTLLRVIGGKESPEGENCKLMLRRGISIGFLEQEPEFYEENTVLEAVLDSDNPLIQATKRYEFALLNPGDTKEMMAASAKMDDLKAWDFEARIKEVLFKLNITGLDQTIKTMSGGQKKRLALAKLIIDEPEFLILDEPTNHLDLDMIEWLEEYLSKQNMTILMVTHDRYFLELVCNQIVELDRGKVFKYSGNYSEFLQKKAVRHENESTEMEKNRKLLKKELEWVNRMPKARGTKAKSRVDAFFDLKEKSSNKIDRSEVQIEIKGQRLGKKILEAHYINKSFGDLKIVENFDYKFKKEEKVGIVGPNGVGKSTFMGLLTKEIRPDTGKIVVGENTVFGYYSQDGILLEEDKRVIEVIRNIAEYIPLENGRKLTAEQALEQFLFDRKKQQVYVSKLSGGERRRLYLLTVLMKNPNFLILDEPTNDLDIITLNILEEFLLAFPGCVIIVSHDRYFLDKLADHLFIFEGNGKIRDFNGNYTDYREQQKQALTEQRKLAEKTDKPKTASAQDQKPGLTYEQRKQLSRLEKQLSKLEEQKEAIEAKFTDASITPEEIMKLAKELDTLKSTIEVVELEWMELVELGE